MGGAAGRRVHGFVHGKLYEVEHENVGTEGAHRSELVGEAVGGKAVRFVKSASEPIRPGPPPAESQYIKAQADYQTRKLAQEQPEAFKSAAARLWHRQKLKRQYQKQAREAAKQGPRPPENRRHHGKSGRAHRGRGTAASCGSVGPDRLCPPVGGNAVVYVLFGICGQQHRGRGGRQHLPCEDVDMLGAEADYCNLGSGASGLPEQL